MAAFVPLKVEIDVSAVDAVVASARDAIDSANELVEATDELSTLVEIDPDWFGRITDAITAAALVVIALALVF